ncbi:hypothetical protein [Chryseobacterium mucoviscidosis]|uniref:Beta-lactamase-inhibitor-like PepSY-like domain-containing protein n=1 Tax=Chryseobacterium mucoviscidosis TaxID=1945581 RepID=A0A202BWJ0_9FLAO|nr:hypothetical protein [Chryseobacterium mucoviscidosis]OVE55841.1 hypothetical protein B0E34_16640 [Chryseobacterium mucoviscidosis]
MRKILLLLLNFVILNCYAQKKSSDIIYFLPESVNDILIKELQKKHNNNFYLVLDKESTDTYVVYLNQFSSDSPKNIWIEYSNRSAFLKGNLIPLYFYADEYFSYAEKGEEVLKSLGTDKEIKKTINIRDNVFNIKFKLGGEIVK